MEQIEELYRHVIREHSSNPRNCYILDDYTHSAHLNNTLCGDEITIYCHVAVQNDTERIRNISFDATGCAIMKASASLLTDNVKGCTVETASILASSFMAFLQGDSSMLDSDSPFLAFAPVRQYSSRIKCAVLPFQALTKALQSPTLLSHGHLVERFL